MTITYRTSRNIMASIEYYISSQLVADNWTGWTCVRGFKRAYDFVLPVITVDSGSEVINSFEIGSNNFLRDVKLNIDVFGRTPTERVDMKDWLIGILRDGCIYYTHVIGNDGQPTRTAHGRIIIKKIESNAVNFKTDLSNLHEMDKNRWQLILIVTTGSVES